MSTLYFTRDHEWISVDGSNAAVGITDFAQKQLGDVVFVELPETGRKLEIGQPFGVVESVKAASEIYAPVSGQVTAINEELSSDPELVNQDPEGDGWIIKLKLSDPGELKDLMDRAAYDKYVKDEN